MPALMSEMRADLTDNPVSREFVVLRRAWAYWASGHELVYYYDDHEELDNKLRILLNYGLIQDITHTNVGKFVLTEELVDNLTIQ